MKTNKLNDKMLRGDINSRESSSNGRRDVDARHIWQGAGGGPALLSMWSTHRLWLSKPILR